MTYKVFVNIPSGEKVTVDVNESYNINTLKASVCNEGLNFRDVSLVFGGKQLNGLETIKEAGIVENSNVEAIVAVKGKVCYLEALL